MLSVSIPGIHGQSKQCHSLVLYPFGQSLYHRGELWGLCPLSLRPVVHQHGRGARRRRAFETILRASRNILQDRAGNLQLPILLQQSDPIFSLWTHSASKKRVSESYWHTTGVMRGELFLPLTLRWRRYSGSQRLQRSGLYSARDTTRH